MNVRPTVVQDVHLVPRSGNSKTGPLPVTYRPMTTCPTDCPFLPGGDQSATQGGCYGTGRLFASAMHRSTTLDVEAGVWKVRLGKDATARYLRDRVVGDLLTPAGDIDRDYLTAIADIATANDLIPFGYTHAWRRFSTGDVVWLASIGYVMNASVETRAQAAQAAGLGLPVTIVDDVTPDGATVAGQRLITCPAQTRDDVACADCGLCAKADRTTVIRFRPHGAAEQRARRAIAAARDHS